MRTWQWIILSSVVVLLVLTQVHNSAFINVLAALILAINTVNAFELFRQRKNK